MGSLPLRGPLAEAAAERVVTAGRPPSAAEEPLWQASVAAGPRGEAAEEMTGPWRAPGKVPLGEAAALLAGQ